MIRRDYHGMFVQEALNDAELAIGRVRMLGKQEDAEFITGHGVIREKLFNHLKDRGLEPTYKLNNSGVIYVVIE